MRLVSKLCLYFILSISSLLAQEAVVIAVKGNVQVVRYHNTIKPYAGLKIGGDDKIKVDTGGYMALILSSGKALEVKNAGTYSVKDFSLFSRADSSSHSSRYSKYVLNQAIAYSGQRYTGKTLGTVTRSVLAPVPLTPPSTYFYADSVILSWQRVYDAQGYIVLIMSNDGTILSIIQVPAHVHEICVDMSKIVHQPGCYYWLISTKKNPEILSRKHCFYVLHSEDETKIKEEEANIISDLDLDQAISYAILGRFYEAKKMYAYAIKAYDKALQLEQDVDFYLFMRNNVGHRAIEDLSTK